MKSGGEEWIWYILAHISSSLAVGNFLDSFAVFPVFFLVTSPTMETVESHHGGM